jgi:hypothetical protein
VNSKRKSTSVLTTTVNTSVGEIVFNVLGAAADGGAKSITLHVERISAENREYAMFHGLVQRGSDGAALSRNRETGKPATAAAKFDAVSEIVAHLESGTKEWRLAGASRGIGDFAVLVSALVEHTGRDEYYIRAYLDKKTAGEQRTLLNSEKIIPIANRIRARLAADVDTDGLLADLDSDELDESDDGETESE